MIILIIFHNALVIENFKNIQILQDKMKDIRLAAYNIEKLVVNEEKEEVILPKKYEQYIDKFFLYEYNCSIIQNSKLIHPNITVKNFKFDDNSYLKDNLLVESKIEQLKFQNLLTEKMYRHRKYIKNCY